jgi:very-short-patch-repair endonuclease
MDWPDLCRTQAGVITRAQLLERGLTESALLGLIKRRALIQMHPGVYSPRPVPGSFAQRAWAGALWSGGVLSHRSAAQMHGLPVPRSRLIHVTVPREVHRSVAGVKLHRTSSNPYRPVSMDGLPVTSRTVTIVELLRGEPARVARDLFDRSVQQGWLSGDDLSGAIVHEPGRAGNAQLRRLIAMYEAGAQAQSERILHHLLRRAHITGWIPQYGVQLPSRFAYLDVGFPEHMLAVEVDGRRGHDDFSDRFESDRIRQNELIGCGWRVLRFTWSALTRRPDRVIAEISRILAEKSS